MRIPPHPWDPGFNCSFAVRLLFPLLFHLQRLLFHLCPRHPARLPDLAVSPSLAPWFPLSQSALLCPTSLTAGLGGGGVDPSRCSCSGPASLFLVKLQMLELLGRINFNTKRFLSQMYAASVSGPVYPLQPFFFLFF